MKIIKRLFFFFSLFLVYLILREFLQLISWTRSVHPVLGSVTLLLILLVVCVFVIFPVFKILRLPRYKGPTLNPDEEETLIVARIKKFQKNSHLRQTGFDFSEVTENRQGYDKIMAAMQVGCHEIRKKYVSQLLITSSIAQNGFIDAVLILSASVNMVKEIFVLFNGRVSYKDLFTITKKVYYSMAIGGSEGIETATEELMSKLTLDSLKAIPLANKVFSSLVDGLINAVLLARISFITQNFCTMTYIESEKNIYPPARLYVSETYTITADIIKGKIRSVSGFTKKKIFSFRKKKA